MPDDADFHVQGKFPAQISMPDTDLCIILSNLLKNAVEAVERIDDCSDKTNHGFGLKNVNDALKRNDGRMDIQFHDGLFCVCAVTPAIYL
jgi:sensor histidine kinase regulating citrate/malate metabolism